MKSKSQLEEDDLKQVSQFLYEVGTMRKVARMHCQTLLTDDMSDNTATHTFRVVVIGFFLAKMEGTDPYKVMLMCLLHDMAEARTNDHNWIHKCYVVEHEDQVLEEQLGKLPYGESAEVAHEYSERESPEAIVAKDADILDQVLLLHECVWQGNLEAQQWLDGKRKKSPYNYLKYLTTESAKTLGKAIYDEEPSSWWCGLYQNKKRY